MTENKMKATVSQAAVGFVHACMTAPPTGDVTHSMAQMFDTHTAGIRKERDELVAQVKMQRQALEEVDGCFEAALAEGLAEAIVLTSDGRLRDLLNRRLLPARGAAVGALSAIPALPDSPPDGWQVANDELRSMRDAALDKAFDLAAKMAVMVAALDKAYDLSTWAACINWRARDRDNTGKWLDELRERIERTQDAFEAARATFAAVGRVAVAEIEAKALETAAEVAEGWRDGNPDAVAPCSWTGAQIASVIRNKAALARQQAKGGAADA